MLTDATHSRRVMLNHRDLLQWSGGHWSISPACMEWKQGGTSERLPVNQVSSPLFACSPTAQSSQKSLKPEHQCTFTSVSAEIWLLNTIAVRWFREAHRTLSFRRRREDWTEGETLCFLADKVLHKINTQVRSLHKMFYMWDTTEAKSRTGTWPDVEQNKSQLGLPLPPLLY